MQSSLMDQGVTLMLVGMGTVFVFLSLLVIAMSVMAGIVKRAASVSGVTDEEIAAVTAAIARHRDRNS
ncbi:MAG: OadG family protein [Proteobacteria bacterium]|nr:OadG family protein [Pseudomonadota bacterium]